MSDQPPAKQQTAPSLIATAGAAFVLFLVHLAFQDVQHNRMIRNPERTLILLALGVVAVVVTTLRVWHKGTRTAFYTAVGAGLLVGLFSVACLCV